MDKSNFLVYQYWSRWKIRKYLWLYKEANDNAIVLFKYNKKRNFIEELEKRIKLIEERNKKVELDKAWETSYIRKICIMVLTYIVVIIYSYLVRNYDNILLSSFVPVIGFTLSTLSLKLVRKLWEQKQK